MRVSLLLLSLSLLACTAVQAASQPDVLVIGAGASGLSAAQSLVTAGYKVAVLEARNRTGGRVWSVPVPSANATIDLGGAWINGVTGNPITELAAANGIQTVPSGFTSTVYNADGSEVSAAAQDAGDALFARFSTYLADQQDGEELQQSASLQQVMNTFAADEQLSPSQVQSLADSVNWIYTQEYAASPGNLSAEYFDGGADFGGGNEEAVLFPGGYGQVIGVLARNVPISLSSEVTGIRCGADSVTVTLANGTALTAQAAVVTLPLGVLQKHAASLFSPPLPAAKAAAVSRMGMGLLDKVILVFPTVFWEDVAWLERAPSGPPDQAYFTEIFNVAKAVPSLKALVAFNSGNSAWHAERSLTGAQLVEKALDALRQIYGTIPAPTETFVTRWGSDPYSLGSYSFTKAGAIWADHGVLGQPFGRCSFAGEATRTDYPATVHGAYLSGQAAAREVKASGIKPGAGGPAPGGSADATASGTPSAAPPPMPATNGAAAGCGAARFAAPVVLLLLPLLAAGAALFM